MSRLAVKIELSDAERKELIRIINSGKSEARLVKRSKIILCCSEGLSNQEVALKEGVSVLTVGKWRRRFSLHSLSGLSDAARSGKPSDMPYEQLREKVIVKASETPPPGH